MLPWRPVVQLRVREVYVLPVVHPLEVSIAVGVARSQSVAVVHDAQVDRHPDPHEGPLDASCGSQKYDRY